jgi:hypothetical protein
LIISKPLDAAGRERVWSAQLFPRPAGR